MKKNPKFSKNLFPVFLGVLPIISCSDMATKRFAERTLKDQEKPNILFISIDDLNDWVGYLEGHPDTRTPNIDRLAERGTAFMNSHTSAPVCNPSRVALLTGVAPHRSGCYQNADHWRDSRPLEGAVSMFRHFRQQGYETLIGGKIHHAFTARSIPDKEFNNSLDLYGGVFGNFNFRLFAEDFIDPFAELKGRFNWALHWGPMNQEQSDSLADGKIVQWAKEQLYREYEKPFFMGVGFMRPHVPLTAPARFFEMFDHDKIALAPLMDDELAGIPHMGKELAITSHVEMTGGHYNVIREKGLEKEITLAYLASVAYVDWCVGEVLNALEDSPHADNTIVVLWSDHGWGLRERYHWTKWGLWEDITRVPFIMAGPNTGKPGKKIKAGVAAIDIYPTLIELCRLPSPPQQLDGQSLVPLLKNPRAKWQRPAMITLGPGNHALRDERWRYIHWSDGGEELYDHRSDPNEWYNLADNPETSKVIERMKKWLPESEAPAVASNLPVKDRYELEVPQIYDMHSQQPGIVGRGISIKAYIEPESPDGVILKMGGIFSGICLYMKENKLYLAVMDIPTPLSPKTLTPETTIIGTSDVLPKGKVAVEGELAKDGSMTIRINGKTQATGKTRGPLSVYPAGEITTGGDLRLFNPPVGHYEQDKSRFKGKIENLVMEFN